MEPVNLKEARRRLSELVDAAARGESVILTRRGKRVARLVPLSRRPRSSLPELSAFRRTLRIKGKGVSETVLALRARERF